MPAYVWITALAAVVFVVWFGWARRWWRSLRYSWTRARHLVDLGETEAIPGAEWGSMIYDEDPRGPEIVARVAEFGDIAGPPEGRMWAEIAEGWLPAPPDWREQTAADLSPEALDDAIERACEADRLAVALEMGWLAPEDSGPGGPFSSAPGPDPAPTRGAAQGRAAGVRLESRPAARADLTGSLAPRPSEERPGPVSAPPDPGTRLADTGDVRDAHMLADVLAELRRQDDDTAAYLSRLRSACAQYRLEVAGALG